MRARLFISLFLMILLSLLTGTTATRRVVSLVPEIRGNHLEAGELLALGSGPAFAGNVEVELTNQANPFYPSPISSSAASGGTTTRVSVASDRSQANDDSGTPSISPDGRYVSFSSLASNLVPGDTNDIRDVFVHDHHTGHTSRVSVASDGTEGNGDSYLPSFLADGRYIAFHSEASNLVPGDTNGASDIFVHDQQTGETTRVSVASNGTQGNGGSYWKSISANGRYVAFDSLASNLVPGDINNAKDVFVHDRQTGQTSRVSVTSSGAQGNGNSGVPYISADGRYVAFFSDATNLVPSDTNGVRDVFVHDRQTGQTTRVSVASNGAQANGMSQFSSISTDGRYVAFESWASNLVPGDTNDASDIFIHDRQTGETTRVSVASGGTQGNGYSSWPSISADGRYVAFFSDASNLVPGDTNGVRDVFVHDRQTGQTSRISVATDGTQGNDDSYWPSISANGLYIAFHSWASNLVPGDTNGARDNFIHDRSNSGVFSISGKITSADNNPIAGVTVSTTSGHSATTNTNGDYTITGLIIGTYTLSPSKTGYTFSPTSRTIAVPPGASGQDFTGSTVAPQLPDYIVTAIEVTQGIQDLSNSIPLIAHKQTYVRVHVRNQGSPSLALVTARLCRFEHCLVPSNAGERIRIPTDPDRGVLDQSFYFELPGEWLSGSLILIAEVNPPGVGHVEESDTANNMMSLPEPIGFNMVPPVRVRLYGVQYRTWPFIWQVHEPRQVDYDLILSWLRRAYPTASVSWHRDIIDYGRGLPTCSELNQRLLVRSIFDRLEDRVNPHTRYYGIVSDSGGFMRGCAISIPGTVASGPAGLPAGTFPWDTDASYGDWYAAHELGHTYGTRHPGHCNDQPRDPDHPGGDYPHGNISPQDGSMYGFDIALVDIYTPFDWHDVMTYCDYQWISGFTYQEIYDRLASQQEAPAALMSTSIGEALLVFGQVNHTLGTAKLDTSYRIPEVSVPAPALSGTHSIRLIDAMGGILAEYPFTPGKDTDAHDDEDELGLFGEVIPWITGTQRIAIYAAALQLDSVEVSAHAPSVELISPNGGEVFTDTVVVSWSASDTDLDPLSYVIQYSPDSGSGWQTVATGITNTTVYTMNLSLLPGSDEALLRVIASDGVNTGMDVSDAPFRVTGKEPQAHIHAPLSGRTYTAEQTIILVGEGTDVEDGMLPDTALSWRSSIAGDLGTGRMLTVSGLPTGVHTITLTVSDSGGQTGSASIQVTVGYHIHIPVILRN